MAQKSSSTGLANGTMNNNEIFLSKALEKLLAEKEIRKSSFLKLKQACEQALAAKTKENLEEGDLTVFFMPLEMACASKHPKMMETALDCLQKLLHNGHDFCRIVDPEDPTKLLTDRIVTITCDCFQGTQTEERVELQILKICLTILSSSSIEIDYRSVLQIVRTCFTIYITTRSKINEATAQATLTQLLQSIFAKMEQKVSLVNERKKVERIPGEFDQDQQIVAEILDELIEKICYDEATLNGQDDVQSNDGETRSNVTDSIEQSSFASRPVSSEELSADNAYRSAFHVFGTLCKLSDRDIRDKRNNDPKTNLDVKSRIFSLRLILQVLQNAGPVFRSSEDFLRLIKSHLCVSLSRNGVSLIFDLFEMALSNFVELIGNFKSNLKIQIEVLFREIFLTILETPNSPFRHKWLIIQSLSKICGDAQILVDLFVNYDCSMRSTNIFERLVVVLSRLAQGRQAFEIGCTVAEEHNLRIKSVECLVSILGCMVDWSKDLYVNPQLQSNLASDSKGSNENLDDQESNKSLSGNVRARSDSSSSRVSSQLSENINDLELVRQRKELIERGIDLFNKHPRRGLEYFYDKTILNRDAQEIGRFFHEYGDQLDKTIVGDCLGDDDKFFKEIMYAYVDRFDFSKMEFLTALRNFLSAFRLPGEAQKIDRLMEKFAARYCECNSNLELFASADAAYVLAYSVIMLTTDLHSKNVKHKMTKEQYIKMNRGINDSRDLPPEFLSKIYDEIKNEEIKLKTSNNTNKRLTNSNPSEKQREISLSVQMKDVEDVARDLMSSAGSIQEEFTSAKHHEHVRPMFQKSWSPCLAAFSINVKDTEDMNLVNYCLTGMSYAIRIACIFHMELERNAFLQTLSRFTLLTVTSQVTDIKAKNVACLRTLLTIGQTDGNYLGASWYDILKCISQLELAQLFNVHGVKGKSNQTNATNKRLQLIQDQLNETSSQSIIISVDRVFSGSARLDGDAIVSFVENLCRVSTDELQTQPARMYSLSKVVEISYYNMGRIRLQWSRIWAVIGEHFNRVVSHSSQEISFFAIDSLRQLSTKFLEKGEFANFRFQKEFLKPFEMIMKFNRLLPVRDMVVRCVAQFVQSQPKNIRSGWKNIFSVLQMAAVDHDPQIVELAFQTITQIINVVFDRHFPAILDSFQDATKCLAEFSCNLSLETVDLSRYQNSSFYSDSESTSFSNDSFPDTSMEAIRLMRKCANHVHEKSQIFNEHGGEDLLNVAETDRIWVKGWFSILFELSSIINRSKLDVRTRALTVMFEIMKTYGDTFLEHWWKEVFQIVFRIFDTMKLSDIAVERNEWMTTTCNHALYAIVDVFTQFYLKIPKDLVGELYRHVLWCVHQENDQLVRSALNCLENFIIACGRIFSEEIWEKTCSTLLEIYRSTVPAELLTWPNGSEQNENETKFDRTIFPSLTLNSLVQLELIQTIDNIFFYPSNGKKQELENLSLAQHFDKISTNEELSKLSVGEDRSTLVRSPEKNDEEEVGMFKFMSFDQTVSLIDCLIESHRFAVKFNSNPEQRSLLWTNAFAGKNKPNLFLQETQSIACALRILFRLFDDELFKDRRPILLDKISNLTRPALEYFLNLQFNEHRDAWSNVLILLVAQLLKLNDESFEYFSKSFYLLMSEIVIFDLKAELRYLLREYFLRIGQTYHINRD